MNWKQYLWGCLNSALHQSAKLALVVFSAYVVGLYLSLPTLLYAASVGWLYGIFQWVGANPLPDEGITYVSKDSLGNVTLLTKPPIRSIDANEK